MGKSVFRSHTGFSPLVHCCGTGGVRGEPFKYLKHHLKEMAAVYMGTAHMLWAAGAANTFFFPSTHSGCLVTSPCLIYLAVSLRGKAMGWVCYSLWMFCSVPAYLHSLLSDEYTWCVSKCLESFLVDVALPCTVNILLCHVQIKI